MTDVVSVDPLFTVSIYSHSDSPLGRLVALCYQIHGDANTYYNILTTPYTSVNGFWSGITESLNLLTKIGVQAISSSGACQSVLVELEGCAVTINGDRLTTDFHRNFPADGVFFSRQEGVVNMRVPNGDQEDLQLMVECETRTMFNDGESVSIPMLRLTIIRTLTAPSGTSNGLIGLLATT